jgi:hypothetical protein
MLGLRCLLLCVLAIICLHRTKQTLPATPAMQTTTVQLTTMQTTSKADDNADVNADNNNAMHTTDDNADVG